MTDRHPLAPSVARRRRPRFRTVVALAVGLLVAGLAPVAAVAAPPPATVVLSTDRDVGPGGALTTTTFGLDPGGSARSGEVNRPGWSIDVNVPSGTQQVGLQWQGDPIAQFSIRTSSGAGQETSVLTGETLDGPDGTGGRPGAGPVWLGPAGVDQVHIELVAGLVSDIRLDAMSFAPAPSPGGTRAAPRGVAYPATRAGGPPIHLRSTWAPGGWYPRDPVCGPVPKVSNDLRHGIVHHTAGANSYRPADVPAILAGIYRFHTRTRGWCDIAYNFLIDRFGGVWEGRLGGIDNAAWGGHTKGFNDASTGVALLGTFEAPGIGPPTAMMSSLRSTLAWKLGSQGLNPRGRTNVRSSGSPKYPAGTVANLPVINGHRDTSTTSCPGSNVYAQLPRLRIDVANLIAATNDPARWAPHATGARYWTRMFTDAEGRLTRPSRIGSFTSAVVRAGYGQADLAALVVLSPASDARVGVVDRLYRVALGRGADTGGLRAKVAGLDRGTSRDGLAGSLLRSGEFRSRYGSPDDRAFTTLMFQKALGRNPSAASLAYWQRRLARGLTRSKMLLHFSEHPQHRARAATATSITTAFFVTLRRVPSSASLAYWTPRVNSGTGSRELVVRLLRNQEYRARF